MKTCTKCGETKPEKDFSKKGSGLRAQCKGCDSATLREWRQANPERVAEKTKLWREANQEGLVAKRHTAYLANRERNIAYSRAWREANKEHAAARDRAWRSANHEHVSSRSQAYREANREQHLRKMKIWSAANAARRAWLEARRRAQKASVAVDPAANLEAVAAIHGWLCYICGVACNATLPRNDPHKANLEHVVALSRGGTHTFDNLRIACRRCNQIKGARRTAEQVREMLNGAT